MALGIVLACCLVPAAALGQITPTPSAVTVTGGGPGSTVNLGLTFDPPTLGSGTGTVNFTGLPSGVTTQPSPVTFPFFAGVGSASTSFLFQATASAPAGTYPVTMTATGVTCGGLPCTGSLTLTVVQPSFTSQVSPNPVQLQWGGPPQTVTVTTVPDAGFAANIVYAFQGFPSGVTWGSQQTVSSPYPPVTFPFSVAAGTPPGSYTGTLTATVIGRPPATYPMTVVVDQPQLRVSFASPSVQVCDGGPAIANEIILEPLLGYSGTPQLAFGSTPPGVVVSPSSPVSPPLPPSQRIPFTVSASGASPGMYSIPLQVRDPAAGVDLTVQLALNVAGQAFEAHLSPPNLTVQAGGAAGSITAGITPGTCFTAPEVEVTVSGAPAGLGLSPATAVLPGPAYAPVTFTVRPEATLPPGSYPVTFRFTTAGGPTRDVQATITVTGAPGFTLTVTPPAVTVEAGGTTVLVFRVDPLRGFTGSADIRIQTPPGLTAEPASFPVPAGATRQVTLGCAPDRQVGLANLTVEASAPGVPDIHHSTVPVTVLPRPPSIASVTPPAFSPGTQDSVVRLTGENFKPGAVASSPSPDLVFSRTTILSPTLAEAVVTVRPDAAPGPRRVDLTNPDGGTTREGGLLLVARSGSIGAPLGVTVAAIVFPREDALITPTDRVYPRGLLATTGLGTIVGTWRLDGIPFERFTVSASAGMPVKVEATTPIPAISLGSHTLELAVEQPRSLVSAPVGIVVSLESFSGLEVFAPEDGAVFGREPPLFRWSLVPGASGYEIEITRGPRSRRFLRRLPESEWRPTAGDVEELGPGVHRFRVRPVFPGDVPGEPSPWLEFTIPGDPDSTGAANDLEGPGPSASRTTGMGGAISRCSLGTRKGPDAFVLASLAVPEDQGAAAGARSGQSGGTLRRDGEGVGMATVTLQDQDGDSQGSAARLQLSTRLDVGSRAVQLKATADLAGRHDMDEPRKTVLESHNWDLLLGVGNPEKIRGIARVGYSPPGFLDQSQFLSAGPARGGVEAGIATPVGSLTYYRTANTIPSATVGMPLSGPQRIEAVGYQYPGVPGRTVFRLSWLRSEDAGGYFTPPSDSQAFGMLWMHSISPAVALSFEGAWGWTKPEGFEERVEGGAFRLAASGQAGVLNYSVGLRKTDATFVNPANPGLTAGGVPDRRGVDLSLSALLGTATLSLQAHRLESGFDSPNVPKVAENGAILNLNVPFGTKVMLAASGTLITNTGRADTALGLPATDRSQRGLSLNLTENLGRTMLTQSLTWQDMADHALPGMDQTVTGVNLSATTTPGPAFSLMATLSGTRTRAAPQMGRTDQLLATLQPTLTWAAANLSVTLRGSYGRVKNDVADSLSQSEQYQVAVQWSPAWLGSLLAFQATAGWSRMRSSYQPGGAPFHRSLSFSLVLRRSAALPPPASPTTSGLDPHRQSWRTAALLRQPIPPARRP